MYVWKWVWIVFEVWEVIGIVLEDNCGGFYIYIGFGGVFVNIVFEIGLEFGVLFWV